MLQSATGQLARSLAAIFATMVIVSLSGCSSAQGPPNVSQTSPPNCRPSALQRGPGEYSNKALAKAGPLWLSAFGDATPGSPAQLADGGPIDGWKVLIHPDPSAVGIVRITGEDCTSRAKVKFCYVQAGCTWEMRLNASVASLDIDLTKKSDYNGYMLFPSHGLVRLIVSDASRALGTVTIDVPAVGS